MSISRSASSAAPSSNRGLGTTRGHERSTSLGALAAARTPAHKQSPQPTLPKPAGISELFSDMEGSPGPRTSSDTVAESSKQAGRTTSPDKPLPIPPSEDAESGKKPNTPPTVLLRPHIISPRPNEFLLTTGTTYDDAAWACSSTPMATSFVAPSSSRSTPKRSCWTETPWMEILHDPKMMTAPKTTH